MILRLGGLLLLYNFRDGSHDAMPFSFDTLVPDLITLTLYLTSFFERETYSLLASEAFGMVVQMMKSGAGV